MPAGTQTAANTAAVWTDLTKLSPMAWLNGARLEVKAVQPIFDLYMVDQLDQFNRDYGAIASSGFGHVTVEGADYQVRTNNQGDTASVSVVKRTDAFTITEDLVDGKKYREIKLGMEDLGGSLFRTRARDATHPFTFGFSTNLTDADGGTQYYCSVAKAGSEPLFDDTHTMATADTFDNELVDTAIGETAMRNIHDLTTSFLDENGFRVPWGKGSEKVLITSDDIGMNHAAKRLTTQEWNYNNANRDMNVFRDFSHLPLFYLNTAAAGTVDSTKDKYYFIVDRGLMGRLAIFADHTKPMPEGPFEDMYNGGQLWRSKTRYDIAIQGAVIGAGCAAST